MRRRNEPIEVRLGRIGEGISGLDPRDEQYLEGPSQFLWRNRLWRVLRVQQHWIESGAWWEAAEVRAARGDWDETDDEFDGFATAEGAPVRDGADRGGMRAARGVPGGSSPLLEYDVWRVEAASGQFFSRGVYELAQDSQQGDWLLRAVVD